MSWASEAAKSLLPLSVEKRSLEKALKEWFYTDRFEDLEEAIETCQLCQHPDIRYQFEIQNRHTGHQLLVGSECITKFEIDVLDEDGRKLNKDEARSKVLSHRRQLVEAARQKRVVRNLIELGKTGGFWSSDNVDSFIGYYRSEDGFTPNQMRSVMWGLQNNRIKFKQTDFKLKIKQHKWRDQVVSMSSADRATIWGCLTKAQQESIQKRMDELARWKRHRQDSGYND